MLRVSDLATRSAVDAPMTARLFQESDSDDEFNSESKGTVGGRAESKHNEGVPPSVSQPTQREAYGLRYPLKPLEVGSLAGPDCGQLFYLEVCKDVECVCWLCQRSSAGCLTCVCCGRGLLQK